MNRFARIIALVWLWGIPSVFGHPVTFKGGSTFSAFNQADMYDWQLNHTFIPRWSLGVDFIRDTMEGRERYFLVPRLAWLLHRWNETESQANIYVSAGAGLARKEGLNEAAISAALDADYETREIYLSAKTMLIAARNFDTFALYQARAGFAPYVGESDELHSWLLAQVQYLPYAREEVLRIGPVLRMFYKTVLWELGVTARGNWNFNFMVHW